MVNKVVARFADGRILKGIVADFFPGKDVFHLSPADAPPGSASTEVRTRDLKAVFFVKDFGGDATYEERREFDRGQRPVGRKIRVRFKDGEVLVGTTQGYDASRPGFFVIPADPNSNNIRCYVVADATQTVEFI